MYILTRYVYTATFVAVTLGEYIKAGRKRRGLTQQEFADITGIKRSHLSRIEKDAFKKINADIIIKIARGFKVDEDEVFAAAGLKPARKSSVVLKSPNEALKELNRLMPVAVPIIGDIHAGPSDIVDYAFWTQPKAGKRVFGLRVHGYCMKEAGIDEGDLIFIDPDGSPAPDDVILAVNHESEALLYGDAQIPGDFQVQGVVVDVDKGKPKRPRKEKRH